MARANRSRAPTASPRSTSRTRRIPTRRWCWSSTIPRTRRCTTSPHICLPSSDWVTGKDKREQGIGRGSISQEAFGHMKKHLLLVSSLLAGSALVLAQGGSQDRRAGPPGHPDWKGQPLQTSPAPPNAQAGGLDPMDVIKKPLSDQWTSYSGDMSGKRFSLLK